MDHQSLIQLDRAKGAIMQARSVQELKGIRDKAEALRVYARQAKDSLEIQNHCAEIKIRAERRAGEMLRDAEKHKGGRPTKNQSHDVTSLKDADISKMESHRWQRVASVPEPVFEHHIAETMDAKRELTTVGVIKLANQSKPRNGAVRVEKSDSVFVKNLDDLDGQKFSCIYADPPWRYSNQSTRASTDNHYSTMTVDEICALPVADLCAERCHLHLWTTNGFLFECQKIFEAWGFTFKSSYIWVKPQMGIGNYWRNSHEFLLLAVRGGMVSQAKDLISWGRFDRAAHSEKPQGIRKLVERFSPGPYLELFGRRRADNWTVFGNEMLPQHLEMEV
jgi:N6-adenosine-specific RNA methylase IME4